MLLSSRAIRPDNRSRSVIKARTCAANSCVIGLEPSHSRGHPAYCGRIGGGEDTPQAPTGGFSLAGNCQREQGNCRHAAPAAKPNKRIEFTPPPAGAREPSSGGVCSIAMAPS
jgi:hypothetical protein